jgi:hypothetical protein
MYVVTYKYQLQRLFEWTERMIVHGKLEGMGKEVFVIYLIKYYAGVCLELLSKVRKYLSQNSC